MVLQYFIFATLLISAATKCPPGSVYRHSTKCYKFHPEISSFDVANLSCSILNGYLARVRDQEENNFLTQQSKLHFKDAQLFDAWIGGSRGSFSLLDSKPLGSSLNLSERYCISLQLDNEYWKANHCEKSTRKPYICEYELSVNTVAPRNSTTPKTISDATTVPPPATTEQHTFKPVTFVPKDLTAQSSKITGATTWLPAAPTTQQLADATQSLFPTVITDNPRFDAEPTTHPVAHIPDPLTTISSNTQSNTASLLPKDLTPQSSNVDTTTQFLETTTPLIVTTQQLLSPTPQQSQSSKCPSEWLHFNAYCYQAVTTQYMWQDSENWCLNQNAHVASIHNEDEYNFVEGIISNFDNAQRCFWIGLHSQNKRIWENTDYTDYDFIRSLIPNPRFLDAHDNACVHSCNHKFSNEKHCFRIKMYAVCKKSVVA